MKTLTLALIAPLLMADEVSIGSRTINGVTLSYSTNLEPGVPALDKHSSGAWDTGNTLHRHFNDDAKRTYFAYDVTVERLADGRIRLAFAETDLPPAKMDKMMNSSGWTRLPLPRLGEQILRPGDEMAFDLFVHPQTGQKIVERILVTAPLALPPVQASGRARDFGVLDAWLTLAKPAAAVNGQRLSESPAAIAAGKVVWMQFAERGRFWFSIASRDGYRRAGEVAGRGLFFRWGSDGYAVAAERDIAPGSGPYHLFVKHDPGYRGSAAVGAE